MSNKDDISQIQKYLNGELDARAMHELERRALDDPFLMDALEGYEHASRDQQVNLEDLAARLQQRTDKKVVRMMPWGPLSIAASILILLGAGILFLTRKDVEPPKREQTRVEKPAEPMDKSLAIPPPGAGGNTVKDSTVAGSLAANDKRPAEKANDQAIEKNAVADNVAVAPAAPQSSSPQIAQGLVKKRDTSYLANEYSNIHAKKADTPRDILKGGVSSNTEQIVQSRVPGVTINTPQGRDKARENEAKRLLGVNSDDNNKLNQNMNLTRPRTTDTGDIDESVIGSYAAKDNKNKAVTSRATQGYLANDQQTQAGNGSGRTISGHVKSKDDGEPVIGATVKVIGKPFGVVTDVNGKYILKDVPDNASVIISYIGFYVQKIKVNKADTLDIALYPNKSSLSEVTTISTEPTTFEDASPTQGWEVFKKYVDANAISPDGKTGKVHLSFTVGGTGELSDIKVTRSLSKDADQKAIDILKTNGNWYPATDRKPHTVKLTIRFHQ